MHPDRLFKRKTVTKLFNLCLVVALIFSILPAPTAAAASNAPFAVNADCSATSSVTKVFLPLVTRPLQAAEALVASALESSNAVTPSAPNVRQLNYQVGKTYSYDWNVLIETKSSGRDSQGAIEQQGQQQTVIRGTANVTIQSKAADGTFSGQVTIDSPFVCSTDGTTASVLQGTDYDELVAGLKQPLLFKQSASGQVSEVSVAQGTPILAVNMQKGIVNALQTSLREENAYTAQEQGAQGAYSVQYTITDQSDGTYIKKSYNQNSFSNLISAGDAADELKQNNIVDLVLNTDGVFKSVKSVENMQSSEESQDPPSTGDATLDGVAAWSTTKSEGSLELKAVVDATSDVMAASLAAVYRVDDLGAELSEQIANPKGIDLSEIDLNAEFAALENDPTNPALIMRIADVILADESPEQTVINQVQGRIQQNANNSAVVNAYIDVLTRIGTPKAQSVISSIVSSSLVQAADLSATLTVTSQEHALISMVLLDSPTMTTVNTIKEVTKVDQSALQDTAITVLGATADHLSDENATTEITNELVAGLQNAATDEDVSLYLDALGNTGDPAALSTIQQYISGTVGISDTFGIQVSALTALRKIPGDQAEGLLLNALNKSNDEVSNAEQDATLFAQRELAYSILSSREAVGGAKLSDTAVAALNQHDEAALALPSGYYTFDWNRHLGGSTVGVNLPGFMGIASPSAYYPYLYARQSADAHIWSYTRNLIYGDLLARSTGSAFQFRAYMHIGGGLIRREVNYNLPCSYSAGGNLYNTNITVFDVTVSIPIFWAITVNFNIRGAGYFSLDWSYNHNVCSFTSGNFTGQITPTVWAYGSASAYLDIVVARGGGTLEADLLRTSLPARGSIAYANSSTSFCLNISANTQALNGRFFVWGDLRVPRFGIPPWRWSRIVESTLWTFNTPTASYTLYNRCF